MSQITWNPDDKSSRIDLSNSNMTATSNSTDWGSVRSTIGKISGKWYWEIACDSAIGASMFLGIGTSSANLDNYVGSDFHGWSYYNNIARKYHGGSHSTYGKVYYTGDIIGIALDMDNGTLEFFKNGESQGEAFNNIPTDGTEIFAMVGFVADTSEITVNFGQNEFHIRKSNSLEWNRLLSEDYLPYDFVNAISENEQESSYVSLNPEDYSSRLNLINYNMTAISNSSDWGGARVTHGKILGKWYWETICNNIVEGSSTSRRCLLGVATSSLSTTDWLGSNLLGWGYYSTDGNSYNGTNTYQGETYGTGDIIGIALDMDNGTLEFFKNGESQGEAFNNIPTDGTEIFAMVSLRIINAEITYNFGQTEFSIATTNPTAWINLLSQGYQPYDSNNALWLPRMLILCDGDLMYWNSTQWNTIDYADINSLTKEDVENYAFMPGILDNTKIQALPNDIFKPYLFRLS